MTPENQAQLSKLVWLRESAARARQNRSAAHGELRAAQAAGEGDERSVSTYSDGGGNQLGDPLIYAGLYSPSGLSIVDFLIRVVERPNPKINIGMIDPSCALLLCDLHQPDMPIIYSSDAFTTLTRYTAAEVRGQNCRFLQSPSGRVERGSRRGHFVDSSTVFQLKDRLAAKDEVQVTVTNYKKDGEPFENILTIVPISLHDDEEVRYAVGFLADRRHCFLDPAPPPASLTSSFVVGSVAVPVRQ